VKRTYDQMEDDLDYLHHKLIEAETEIMDLQFAIMKYLNNGEPTHPKTFYDILKEAGEKIENANKHCKSISPNGRACILEAPHDGEHESVGLDDNTFEGWSTEEDYSHTRCNFDTSDHIEVVPHGVKLWDYMKSLWEKNNKVSSSSTETGI
jgi:hypothetical protein